MAGWNTLTTWMKLALVFMAVGLSAFLIGFSTYAWVGNYHGQNYGLWQYKHCPACKPSRIGAVSRHDWYQACQALECIGLIGLAVALLLIILYMCEVSCKRRNTIIAMIVLTFGAVFFIIVGVAVFASKFERFNNLIDWSMGLAIAGAVGASVSGVMQVLELKMK